MPKAVANTTETIHHELKSLPEAFVDVRRMTYGQMIQRREMLKLSVTAAKGSKNFTGEMAMASRDITMFEFAHCVVNHNLEREDGTKMNLGDPRDFNSLDPKVGQEIESIISELNNFEEDDDLGN